MLNKKEISEKYINYILISCEIYSKPEEKEMSYQGGISIRRGIRVKFGSQDWTTLTFEDADLWSKAKKLKVGSFIKIEGKYKNTFSPIKKSSYSHIVVSEIIDTSKSEKRFIKDTKKIKRSLK